jgi:hypothetical protein
LAKRASALYAKDCHPEDTERQTRPLKDEAGDVTSQVYGLHFWETLEERNKIHASNIHQFLAQFLRNIALAPPPRNSFRPVSAQIDAGVLNVGYMAVLDSLGEFD